MEEGRPRKTAEMIRTGLVLTPESLKMLEVVRRAMGATSRSEAIRSLIRDKYIEIAGELPSQAESR